MLERRIRTWLSAAGGALAAAALFLGASARAAEPLQLDFVTHATFFSQETKQPSPLDPQVFVSDGSAAAAVGPQGIEHVAGFRPLLLSDPADTKLSSAKGKPLGFTVGKWLGATGRVIITADPKGGARIVASFEGLKPGGTYSLFENHFDTNPVRFTPLDGKGTRNSFKARRDGSASVSVRSPEMPTGVNAVLLVYHSDGKSHGESRGQIGVNAHHQLIAKVP
jgi:hypothetical protein